MVKEPEQSDVQGSAQAFREPHLHVIVTEGGFCGNEFVRKTFFPAREFARTWQYHVSKSLQEAGLPNELFTKLYKKYNGFYVWVHRAGRIEDAKDIARYLGRYVTFFYEEYRDFETTRHYVTMTTDEFIMEHMAEGAREYSEAYHSQV